MDNIIENNVLTVISNRILECPREIGVRHRDKLKQVCKNLNLFTEKNSESELAIFIANNNNIVIMNYGDIIVLYVPLLSELSKFQYEFLLSQKDKLYCMEEQGVKIGIGIMTTELVTYNRQYYRDLTIEEEIAKLEGKEIIPPLDVLYEEIECVRKFQR